MTARVAFGNARTFTALTARWIIAGTLIAAAAAGAGCGKKKDVGILPAPGSTEPDRYLYEKGNLLLQQKNWLTAREYFKKLVDTYPSSPYRQLGKLGIGDTFLGEGRVDSLILAVNEYREFLTYFPLSTRADYAQYKICLASSKQMLSAQRDQTATVDAIAECEKAARNYPNSEYKTEVDRVRRLARDRLSQSEFEVGKFYARANYVKGALPRFFKLLADDPAFTHTDAVYFYIAELLFKNAAWAEAKPYFARVVTEYPKSEYAKQSQARLAEIDSPKIKK